MTIILDTQVSNYLLDVDWGDRGDEVVESLLLLEDGSHFLLEFGGRLIIEESIPIRVLLEDGVSYWLQEDGGKIIAEVTTPPTRKPLILDTEITNYLLTG